MIKAMAAAASDDEAPYLAETSPLTRRLRMWLSSLIQGIVCSHTLMILERTLSFSTICWLECRGRPLPECSREEAIAFLSIMYVFHRAPHICYSRCDILDQIWMLQLHRNWEVAFENGHCMQCTYVSVWARAAMHTIFYCPHYSASRAVFWIFPWRGRMPAWVHPNLVAKFLTVRKNINICKWKL